eukprot:COSAG06_NODE_2105_length_7546_cov_10.050575_7_plen_82_part_00
MALLATALLLSATPAATTATKPHIIAILADDYGWADAGWHREPGYKEVQTPIMDGLVKSGIASRQLARIPPVWVKSGYKTA